jgi:DNA polymerase-3 subunit delta'
VSVFDALVGQDEVVAALRAAVAPQVSHTGSTMTHAWLFTGPAGSGRSIAALAFAAALQCRQIGCGACHACRTTLGGTHADVRRVIPEGLTIGVEEMRSLVVSAASTPTSGRWQVLLIEDADRLTEAAGNALLKAVEEPPERTVFLLCAPSTHSDDMSITLRSRCRLVNLRSPSADAVAEVVMRRDDVSPEVAQWAAHAAQGHVGRARRLAGDEAARDRRAAVLAVPRSLTQLGVCFTAAADLIAATEAEAAAVTVELDAAEADQLSKAWGEEGTGKGVAAARRGASAARKDLGRRQKSRITRTRRDCLDRALVDLAGFYRDVLLLSMGATADPVHPDMADTARSAAARWAPESVLRRIDAVLACREAIETNVKPLVAVEDMMVTLYLGH